MKTMVYVANSGKGGISAFVLNRREGTLSDRGSYMDEIGLAPLAVSPDRRFLYAAARNEPWRVVAFAIDRDSGELHFLNAVSVAVSPTYMSVDAGGRFLLLASYHGDALAVLALGHEGMVQPEPVCMLRPGRNPHCIVLDASNRFAYAPLLGNDAVALYGFDANTGMLKPGTPCLVPAPREAGPRHMVFRPDGRFAYLLTEMGGEIIKYAVDRENGALLPEHGVPLLPSGKSLPVGTYQPPLNKTGGGNSPTPVLWAADIRITPDGRFLYASERTGSTLSHFMIDPVSGRLDFVELVKVEERPRGFAVDPFGQYLVVAGELSEHVALYGVNRENGSLLRSDRCEVGSAPNWVEMVIV